MQPSHPDPSAPRDVAGLELLARASRLLAGSLNVDRLVRRLLELLVDDVAEWAQVTVGQGRGLHHATHRLRGTGQEVTSGWAVTDGATRSVAGVATSGRRTVLPVVARSDLERIAAPAARAGLAALLPAEAVVLPLTARGSIFGTLTLLDRREGALTGPGRMAVWDDLADRAALAIDSARMYQERRHALDVLQAGLRPPTLIEVPGVRMAAFYRAADTAAGLGGDFYDVHGDAGRWTVVLGDVAGKGVEAAVLAGRARQTVRTAALVDRRPAAVLDLLNQVLVSAADPLEERFITAVCACLRRAEDGGWVADVASAGHPAPLVLRADGRVDRVTVAGALAGLIPGAAYEDVSVALGPGDTLLLYTDGVTEARDAEDEQLGVDRVARLLAELPGAEPEAVVSYIARTALEWAASAPDDVAVLAVHVDAAPGVRS